MILWPILLPRIYIKQHLTQAVINFLLRDLKICFAHFSRHVGSSESEFFTGDTSNIDNFSPGKISLACLGRNNNNKQTNTHTHKNLFIRHLLLHRLRSVDYSF